MDRFDLECSRPALATEEERHNRRRQEIKRLVRTLMPYGLVIVFFAVVLTALFWVRWPTNNKDEFVVERGGYVTIPVWECVKTLPSGFTDRFVTRHEDNYLALEWHGYCCEVVSYRLEVQSVPHDDDGDGYNSPAFGGDDCDDLRPGIHPRAKEADACDDVDSDCDGTDHDSSDCDRLDLDHDGYYTVDEHGHVVDCDDHDARAYPGAGYNEPHNLHTKCCRDEDKDGWCSDSISVPDLYNGLVEGSDCNDQPDQDGDEFAPDVPELDNDQDDDCDGDIDEDP